MRRPCRIALFGALCELERGRRSTQNAPQQGGVDPDLSSRKRANERLLMSGVHRAVPRVTLWSLKRKASELVHTASKPTARLCTDGSRNHQ